MLTLPATIQKGEGKGKREGQKRFWVSLSHNKSLPFEIQKIWESFQNTDLPALTGCLNCLFIVYNKYYAMDYNSETLSANADCEAQDQMGTIPRSCPVPRFLVGAGGRETLAACLGIICYMLKKQKDKLCKRSMTQLHSYKLLNKKQESSFPQEVNPTLRKYFSLQEVLVVL